MSSARREAPAGVGDGVRVGADELLALRRDASRLGPLVARTQTRAAMSGGQRSRLRGRGMEYVESRPYMPGDDVRSIDWRVTARTGRTHTKLFQEERERPVSLIVDLAASMFFGTRRAFKSVVAARAAALIAWSAVARGDRIGALVSAGERHLEVRPRAGRRGAMAVIRALVALGNERPEAGPGLGTTLARARRVLKPGSLLIVVSDFYDLDTEATRHLTRLRAHDELVACWIRDPLEIAPPPPGRYPVSDGRDFALLDLGSAEVRAQYLDHVEHHRSQLVETCSRLKIALVALRTDEDPVEGLARDLAAWSPTPQALST